jgi:PAS domain S-box-containing protein
MTIAASVTMPLRVAENGSHWRRYRHEWFTAAYAAIFLLALVYWTPRGGVWTFLANALYFPMGALTIWTQWALVRSGSLDRRTRMAWAALMASSAIIWLVGIIWTIWLALHPGAESPLWSDWLDGAYIPLAILAFLAFPTQPGLSFRDRRRGIDALLLAIGGIGLSWNFGLLPLLGQPHGPTFVVQLVLVLGEWAVVLFGSFAYLRVSSSSTRRAVAIALGAHMLYILSDYFWASWKLEYTPGHWVDALWFSAWVLRWAAARSAIHGARDAEPADQSQTPYRSGITPTLFVAGAYMLLVFAVLRGDSGGALGIAIAVSTMTALLLVRQSVELGENRRLAQATVAQAARFRSVISHASDFVMVVDQRYAVTYASPSVERAGVAEAGWQFADTIHPDDWATVQRWLEDQAASTATSHRCRVRSPDGGWSDVELRAQDLRGDPHVRGFVVNGRDISDELVLEGRLRHAEKLGALHDMAGRVAHAFNNALASIQGHAELLTHELEMTGTIREDVDAIHAAAERGAGITRQLLGFSGRHVIRPVPLDAADVTRDLIPTLTRLLPPSVDLAVDVAPDVGTLLFDRAQFEQVLVNLVANARDAMPDGGALRVTAIAQGSRTTPNDAAGGRVMIQVSDTGVGISEDDRARIFEPFYTTKAPGRGTGLGLAMVHSIVSRAGGTITVESAVGSGTTFTVVVPAVQLPPRSAAPTPAELMVQPGKGVVLLVDDDAQVRHVSRRLLDRAGFSVIEAVGGADAIAIIGRKGISIDVVVTDMMMAGLSGRDVIDAVRQLRPGTPIVCVTGFAAEHEAEPLAAEVQAIVGKPFTSATLIRAVTAAVSSTNMGT